MIALAWDPARQAGEIQLTAAGGLAEEDGLATAVILSLFLDRRAEPDDELPDEAAGLFARRGWVGDALAPGGGAVAEDRIGSRLWLLGRAKQLPETLRLAEDHAREALDWLREERLVTGIEVAAEWISRGVMGLQIRLALPAAEPRLLTFGLRI